MKKLIIALFLSSTVGVFAQTQETKGVWKTNGNATLLFNQASFGEYWTGGGTGSISGDLSVNYNFNYEQGNWNWDNKAILEYGITKLKDDSFERKTNDRIELNSVLGRKVSEEWLYSAYFNFKTQLTKGYKYKKNTRSEYTNFMSPGDARLGLGMLWKKNDNLKVNISPVAGRLIIVDKEKTINEAFFGVKQGKSTRLELGASLSGYAKFDIMQNVSMENILNLYSNYLEKPQNIDIDYTVNLVLSINKYLSANITAQAIYDEDAVNQIQWRESVGLGVSYKF